MRHVDQGRQIRLSSLGQFTISPSIERFDLLTQTSLDKCRSL